MKILFFTELTSQYKKNIAARNIFQVYHAVLHYLQAVLFLKIWIFFMNILCNSLWKWGGTNYHFKWPGNTHYWKACSDQHV